MIRLKHKFHSNGAITRIAATFAVLVIVPFILFSTIIAVVFQRYTAGELQENMGSAVSVVGTITRDTMSSYEEMTMSLYYNECVEWLDGSSEISEEGKLKIQNSIQSIAASNTSIHAVYLYSGEEVFHSGANYSRLSYIMESHEKEIAEAGGACLWYPTKELTGMDGTTYYILARSLNSTDTKNVGILYLVVDSREISQILEQLTSRKSELYLVDSTGWILQSSAGASQSGIFELDGIPSDIISVNTSLQISGEKYIVSSWKIMSLDWYCIATRSEKDILADILHMESYFIVIAVVYGFFLIIMLLLMLKQYKQEVDEKNRQKMNALTSQLTPHFIYNALNTIKWMAVLNHQENIQKLTESLVHIFMNAAKQDDEHYTVADEIDLIQNYAVVQKARFMNFELSVDVEEECLDCRIRKLLLQPIVENSIVHGLGRGKIKDTTIYVQVWMDENLNILVADEGVGFDVEKWRNEPDTAEDHTNIGLHNVEEIIKLEYGYPYGLEISSEPGKGTTIQYRLPVIKNDFEK